MSNEVSVVPKGLKKRSCGKHRGQHLSLWITDAQMEKLDALVLSSGNSRSQVIRKLIDGRSIPEKSFWKMYSQLASIGGLLKNISEKNCKDKNNSNQLVIIANELLKVAHKLRDDDLEMAIKLSNDILRGDLS